MVLDKYINNVKYTLRTTNPADIVSKATHEVHTSTISFNGSLKNVITNVILNRTVIPHLKLFTEESIIIKTTPNIAKKIFIIAKLNNQTKTIKSLHPKGS